MTERDFTNDADGQPAYQPPAYQPPPGYPPPPAAAYPPPPAPPSYPAPPAAAYPPPPGGYPGQPMPPPVGYPQQPGQPVPPPYPGQPYPGQPYPGQPYPGQPYPGQPYPGQPYPISGVPGYGGVPPQYPAPGQYPVPGPAPRRNTGVIVGIVAAVLLVAIAGIVVVTRISSDSPKSAIDTFFSELRSHDLNGVRGIVCERHQDDFNEQDDVANEGITDITWEVTNVTEDSDTSATVSVELDYRDDGTPEHQSEKYSVVKENGDWKVCGITSD